MTEIKFRGKAPRKTHLHVVLEPAQHEAVTWYRNQYNTSYGEVVRVILQQFLDEHFEADKAAAAAKKKGVA